MDVSSGGQDSSCCHGTQKQILCADGNRVVHWMRSDDAHGWYNVKLHFKAQNVYAILNVLV